MKENYMLFLNSFYFQSCGFIFPYVTLYNNLAKMKNPYSKFHHFLLQFSNFEFCYFSLLNFIYSQLSHSLMFS